MSKEITPARDPMPFSRIVTFTAKALEDAMRQHGNAQRSYLYAWPSFVAPDGKLYPGRVDVVVGESAEPADPYRDHRAAFPVFVRPPRATRWEAVPYSALAERIREALRDEPILGEGDTF